MSETATLRSLESDPAAQAAYAVTLIKPKQARHTLQMALQVVTELPTPDARPGLLAVYEHYNANGPKRDAGGYLRRAVLDALRPIVLPADEALLLEAVTTFEFLPPRFEEEASLIRAGALVVLNELNETLAGYHAAALLVDQHTSEMSGEPAVTAARVLASQDQLVVLYLFVSRPHAGSQPEVVAECLRHLTRLPPTLIPRLVDRLGQSQDSLILIGLYDLLVRHEAGPQALDYLAESLVNLQDGDVYRYLVMALLAARRPVLTDLLVHTARFETNRQRIAVLLEASELFPANVELAELQQHWRQPLG